jgi:MFS family permease
MMAPFFTNQKAQFEIKDQYIGILSSSMFVGMMFGAMFWGMLADSHGRKQAFNLTLIVTTVFGIGASFAPSYWVLCLLILLLGFGVCVLSIHHITRH